MGGVSKEGEIRVAEQSGATPCSASRLVRSDQNRIFGPLILRLFEILQLCACRDTSDTDSGECSGYDVSRGARLRRPESS